MVSFCQLCQLTVPLPKATTTCISVRGLRLSALSDLATSPQKNGTQPCIQLIVPCRTLPPLCYVRSCASQRICATRNQNRLQLNLKTPRQRILHTHTDTHTHTHTHTVLHETRLTTCVGIILHFMCSQKTLFQVTSVLDSETSLMHCSSSLDHDL